MKRKMKGFTLVEMLIVTAIIALLAAIGYPSYMTSVRKSNRAEAKTELMDVTQRLQRCYTGYGRFNPTAGKCTVYDQLTGGGITSRGAGYYQITLDVVTATTYTLRATAVLSPQTGDTHNGCHELTLDHQGVYGPDACW